MTRQRAWQLDRLARGLCQQCGREGLVSATLGRRCLRANRRYNRRRTGSKPWRAGHRGRPPVDR